MTKPLTTTGLTNASLIPVGATVTEAYYNVPHFYGPSPERYETMPQAVSAALMERAERAHKGPFTVDLRWAMTYPPAPHGGVGSGVDMTVQRTTFDSDAEAVAYLDRCARFAGWQPSDPGPAPAAGCDTPSPGHDCAVCQS